MFKEGPKLIKWGLSQCPYAIYGDLVYNLKIKQGHGDHNVTRSLVCSLLKYKDQFLKCFQPIPPFIFLYSLFNSNVLRSGKMSKGIKQFLGGTGSPGSMGNIRPNMSIFENFRLIEALHQFSGPSVKVSKLQVT